MKDINYNYVVWSDPTSVDDWTHVDDVKDEPNTIHSFGILIKETDKVVVLSLNFDPEFNNVSCVMFIPKVLIKYRYEGKMVMKEWTKATK